MNPAHPTPGSLWQERRSNLPEGWRRVVRVETADEPSSNGMVEGIGWPQRRFDGDVWQDETWPGARRRTRIRLPGFLRRYQLIEESSDA